MALVNKRDNVKETKNCLNVSILWCALQAKNITTSAELKIHKKDKPPTNALAVNAIHAVTNVNKCFTMLIHCVTCSRNACVRNDCKWEEDYFQILHS